MLTSEIRDRFLVDELQLGQTLNNAVHAGFKAQFDLLISMLSSDVRDLAWVTDPVVHEKQTEDLRKKFALGNEVRLQSEPKDIDRADQLGNYFREGGLLAVHLQQCLNPEPLTLQHDEIPQEIMDELSPLQREKIRYENEEGKITRVSCYPTPKEVLENVDKSREFLESRFSFVA